MQPFLMRRIRVHLCRAGGWSEDSTGSVERMRSLLAMRPTLQKRTAALIVALLIMPTAARADGFFMEAGPGVARSSGSIAEFVRYQHDAPDLFGQESFYDVSFGTWNGPSGNEAIAVARGIGWRFKAIGYLTFEAGLGRIRTTTDNLDTLFELLLRASCGYRTERFGLSLGFVHYSNGKILLRNIHPPWWEHGPNFGEYFPTLELGVLF
jgi:hypothetical protein